MMIYKKKKFADNTGCAFIIMHALTHSASLMFLSFPSMISPSHINRAQAVSLDSLEPTARKEPE